MNESPMPENDPAPRFLVNQRFHPNTRADWDSYVSWLGIDLEEVVSLDTWLCPRVLRGVRDDDWPYLVAEEGDFDSFTDLDHLVDRVGHLRGRNLLCVYRNPPAPPPAPVSARYDFLFLGHDLVEVGGGISALTNCGGFPDAFASDELAPHGLLASLARANQIQQVLRARYPLVPHANCDVWAIFRALGDQ